MKYDKQKIENIFAVCIVAIFLGQIHINPFDSTVTFSFSIVALSLMFIFFRNIPIIITSSLVSITIFLFRCGIALINEPSMELITAAKLYYGAIIFYLIYGSLFELFDIRKNISVPLKNFLYLFLSEVMANTVEIIITREMISHTFENALKIVILVGIARTTLTLGLYQLIQFFLHRYEKEQQENKFKEMIFMVTSLKTELFFLKKSTNDIEHAMNKSFKIYRKLKDPVLKEEVLSVSRDIHEIKKDYIRVFQGIEKTLVDEKVFDYMTVERIFKMIKSNTDRINSTKNKNITLNMSYDKNLKIKEFYPVISFLNNLIVNAIDAIDNIGNINVKQYIKKNKCIFNIEDNGSGIDKKDLKLIFTPGFSTKYDRETGEFSSGIGMTNVKQIVEQLFDGEISIDSVKGEGTKIEIKIPKENILLDY